jgi:predicted negative regulator of RcsB-dependent stress response
MLTREQFEQYCARHRGDTVDQFRQWLKETGKQIVACHCTDYPACQGWTIKSNEETRTA